MIRYKSWAWAVVAILMVSACAPLSAQNPADPTQPAQATATVAQQPTDPAPTATQTAGVSPTDPPASSNADPSQTTFSLDPAQSEVSYAVDETFLNENNRLNTAIGKTQQITGELTIDLANPAASPSGEFTVDISTLTTDSSRRDNAIRGRWLESSRFPTAKFTLTQVSDFPANPQEGQQIQFKLAGDLLIRDTTKPITWDVTAVLNGGQLTGTATTFLMMADWGVSPPNIGGMLIVKDGVTLTMNFTLVKNS